MAKYLSQEWLDLQTRLAQELPERPGADARLQYVVTGGPDGDVSYFQVVDDGRIVEAAIGVDPDAELTLTQTYADAVQVATGELDANAAFMQGRVKVIGNMGKLMSLMPLTQSQEYRSIVTAVAAQTEF